MPKKNIFSRKFSINSKKYKKNRKYRVKGNRFLTIPLRIPEAYFFEKSDLRYQWICLSFAPPCYFGPENKGGAKDKKIPIFKKISPAAGLKNPIFRRFRHVQKILFRILRFFSAKRIDVDSSLANKISFHECRKHLLSLVE